jgi:hypothetical protein
MCVRYAGAALSMNPTSIGGARRRCAQFFEQQTTDFPIASRLQTPFKVRVAHRKLWVQSLKPDPCLFSALLLATRLLP